MGDNFVAPTERDDLWLGNINFTRDAASALQAVGKRPAPLMFVGREIGSELLGGRLG